MHSERQTECVPDMPKVEAGKQLTTTPTATYVAYKTAETRWKDGQLGLIHDRERKCLRERNSFHALRHWEDESWSGWADLRAAATTPSIVRSNASYSLNCQFGRSRR